MQRTLLLTALTLGLAIAAPAAHAGDACPVGVSVVNLGLPHWAKPALTKQVAGGDAFHDKLVRVAKTQDCTTVSVKKPTDGKVTVRLYEKVPADKMTLTTIKAKLIDKKRRFNCERAARTLKYLNATRDVSGMLLYYRGHRRILLVSPGWKSICISSAKADKMSDRQIAKVWDRVMGPMIQHRIDNP